MTNLTHIWPFFIVTDLRKSVSFYKDKLGFHIRHIGPDGDPYWAIVGRDNISIMLKAITRDVTPVPNYMRHVYAPWDAYISTEDPDRLFGEFSSKDVSFRKPLHNNSDNLRGFEVTDADGYVLFFGKPYLQR
jgi:catechol 2,3-dioxygenase-like lactoylglutathione lyase family enzyme